MSVPLGVFEIADPAALEIYALPLVLVRPDGHVAWRGSSLPGDVRSLLDTVRGAVRSAN